MNLKQLLEDWIGADEPLNDAHKTNSCTGCNTLERNELRQELRASLPSLLAKIEQLIPKETHRDTPVAFLPNKCDVVPRNRYEEKLVLCGYNQCLQDVRDALLNTKEPDNE